MSRRRRTLDEAYRNARYRVDDGGTAFDMIIGEPCAPLHTLMSRRGVQGAAFLTAFNPGSTPRAAEDNRAAQTALREAVEGAGFTVLDGMGLDPEGRWPPEPSLLVLGIPRPERLRLAAGGRTTGAGLDRRARRRATPLAH